MIRIAGVALIGLGVAGWPGRVPLVRAPVRAPTTVTTFRIGIAARPWDRSCGLRSSFTRL
jgi:hypothetical protein